MKYTGTIKNILNMVSMEFNIPPEVITSSHIRTRPVLDARHIALHLACENSYLSKRGIAMRFNMCDHSAILYGAKRIKKSQDPRIKNIVSKLMKKLGQ